MKLFTFKINTLLLPVKAHYFLWNAGTAPVTPFLSVYTKYLGFSSVITGIIFSILPITGMLSKPLLGWVADKFKCQKQIFSFSVILTAVAFIAILYVPKVEQVAEQSSLTCDYTQYEKFLKENKEFGQSAVEQKLDDAFNSTNKYSKRICVFDTNSDQSFLQDPNQILFEKNGTSTYTLSFDNASTYPVKLGEMSCVRVNRKMVAGELTVSDKMFLICAEEGDKSSRQGGVYTDSTFWIFLVLMMIAWLGQAVVVSVSDAICFELLGSEPDKYGQQRCFGSLGWGIFSIIAGVVLDTGKNGEKNYTAGFYLAAGILILDFFSCLALKYEQKFQSTQIIKDVVFLLKDLKTVIFSIWCVFMGICTGLMWNFLFWLIEILSHEEESVKTLEGIVMAIQCLGGELPLFFLSGWIIKKLGHVNTMSLILFTLGIRLILYSVIMNPWYFLPVELSNGITFGLFYACMTSYASIVARPGTGTTVQGAVGALFEVGVALGSFIGGILFDKYGGPMTFRIFGLALLAAGVVHVIVQYSFGRCSADKESIVEPKSAPV